MPSIESADEDIDESTPRTGDEDLLREIRERYSYACGAWKETREERAIDIRYLCGDPWDAEDRKARAAAGRPCINHDELNQYVNQGVNSLRRDKRGIKVEPDPSSGGSGDEKTAELRQDLIRTIEYKSKAQSAYLRAAQDMYEGSYGFFRVSRKYVSDDSDEQEIVIKAIPNPDAVLYDPDCKEPDWSDAQWCFVVEPISKEEFKRRYPRAEKVNFTSEDMKVAGQWVQDRTILVAEYWKVVVTTAKRGRRLIEKKRLVQYITNGVEVLDEIEQPGIEIPIPAMVGLERYASEDGGTTKRKLFSLARLARDPQMSLAYLNSQEMEEAGLSPKTPVRGWVGQFDTDKEAHDSAHKVPHPYLQYDYPEWAMERGVQVGLPEAQQFTPNFQQFEIAKDSARRAIQAAMGISPLPTAMQRDGQKSGVALEKMQTEQAIGSYHFVEGYERAIDRAGRIIESWIPVVYDTERPMSLRLADEKNRIVKVNTPEPYPNEKTGDLEHFPISEDQKHCTTVSTAPSFQSQFDAVSDFLDNLIAQLPKLPIPPPAQAKLLALSIQMKQLGPKGDQMAEIISPEQQGNPQAQAIQQQAQAQISQLQAEIQRLLMEREGKVVENQGRLQIEQFKAGAAQNMEKFKAEVQVTVAEISTKAQSVIERMEMFMDVAKQLQVHQHERGMQAADQAHQEGMAQQQKVQAQNDQAAPQQAQQQQPQVQQ